MDNTQHRFEKLSPWDKRKIIKSLDIPQGKTNFSDGAFISHEHNEEFDYFYYTEDPAKIINAELAVFGDTPEEIEIKIQMSIPQTSGNRFKFNSIEEATDGIFYIKQNQIRKDLSIEEFIELIKEEGDIQAMFLDRKLEAKLKKNQPSRTLFRHSTDHNLCKHGIVYNINWDTYQHNPRLARERLRFSKKGYKKESDIKRKPLLIANQRVSSFIYGFTNEISVGNYVSWHFIRCDSSFNISMLRILLDAYTTMYGKYQYRYLQSYKRFMNHCKRCESKIDISTDIPNELKIWIKKELKSNPPSKRNTKLLKNAAFQNLTEKKGTE